MKVEEAIRRALADTGYTYANHDDAAFLASLRANGYAVVPVDATEKMVKAGEHAWMHRNLADPNSAPLPDCYRAMLAAAQENDDVDTN